MKLYQHEETGMITWAIKIPILSRWFEIPTMYEDEIHPDTSDKVYDWWFDNSMVVDGVRMGPLLDKDM